MTMMYGTPKLYSYNNYEGDKGVIIAQSEEEARQIYHSYYPERQIAKTEEEYFNCGCYMEEKGPLSCIGPLIVTCQW